jgi:hypothetical protein
MCSIENGKIEKITFDPQLHLGNPKFETQSNQIFQMTLEIAYTYVKNSIENKQYICYINLHEIHHNRHKFTKMIENFITNEVKKSRSEVNKIVKYNSIKLIKTIPMKIMGYDMSKYVMYLLNKLPDDECTDKKSDVQKPELTIIYKSTSDLLEIKTEFEEIIGNLESISTETNFESISLP